MTRNLSDRSPRLAGLDGLRAAACLMVFAVHFGQITQLQGRWGPFDIARLLSNGNTGVALFFSLSGFLLSRPYWHALQMRMPMPSPGSYFLRRAARIVPAYYACLTGLIVINRLWQNDGWLSDIVLHYLFVFNLSEASIFSINPPFWTVAVEVQFYLLLPILFAVVRGVSARKAAVFIALFALTAYASSAMLLETFAVASSNATGSPQAAQASPVIEYSTLAHIPHFLLGVLSAWLFATLCARTDAFVAGFGPGGEVVLWTCVLLLFFIVGTPLDDWLQVPHGRYNLPYVPLLLCLVIMLTPITVSGRRLLDAPLARAIGTISFGVYLYHLPIQHLMARLMERASVRPSEHWFAFGGCSLALTLGVSAASYLVLERPVLEAAKRIGMSNRPIHLRP